MKSVPVGTDLRIIIKPLIGNHMPYISTHRFPMSGYEHTNYMIIYYPI